MPVCRISGRLVYYAHVPKCAGQSIESYLTARFGPMAFLDNDHFDRPRSYRWSRSSPQHIVWADFARIVPADWIDSAFAVVRHPVARLVSEYNYLVRTRQVLPKGMRFAEWLSELPNLRQRQPFSYDNHLRCQTDFMPPGARVFRLEDGLDPLVQHLDDLAGDTDGPREIGHENSSEKVFTRRTYAEDLPEEALATAHRLFEEDYARFGYEMAPPSILRIHVPTEASGSYLQLHERSLIARRLARALRLPLPHGER